MIPHEFTVNPGKKGEKITYISINAGILPHFGEDFVMTLAKTIPGDISELCDYPGFIRIKLMPSGVYTVDVLTKGHTPAGAGDMSVQMGVLRDRISELLSQEPAIENEDKRICLVYDFKIGTQLSVCTILNAKTDAVVTEKLNLTQNEFANEWARRAHVVKALVGEYPLHHINFRFCMKENPPMWIPRLSCSFVDHENKPVLPDFISRKQYDMLFSVGRSLMTVYPKSERAPMEIAFEE